jgi:DNA-binding IclR family transcriptional regulator
MRSTDRNDLSALGKAFSIIDACSRSVRPMTLSQVAAAAGLPKSTTHRIVGELVAWGALERENQRLELGAHLFELGACVSLSRQLRETAVPYMEDLYMATHQIVHLGVLEDSDVLYVEKICGRRHADVPTRLGGRMPASCTGLGKAILAFSTPEVVEHVMSHGLIERTHRTITDQVAFRRELRSILIAGVAYDHEENTLGASCVAAPILAESGRPIASISVTGPTGSFVPEKFAQTTRMIALAISREMKRSSKALAVAS